MARTKSSRRWLERHVGDPYVRKARALGFRSRAAFKLQEIDRRERLLRPGMRVADLGAAPGGWAQVAARKVAPGGAVVAIDLLEMEPIPGVAFVQGDFRKAESRVRLAAHLGGKADLVLSDLSPNISGIAATDQARAAELVRLALEFCSEHLRPEGRLLAKAFQGSEFRPVLEALKARFREVKVIKPAASRDESRETYLLATGLKPG